MSRPPRYFNEIPFVRRGYDLYDRFSDIGDMALVAAQPIMQHMVQATDARRQRLEDNLYGDNAATQLYSQNNNRTDMIINAGSSGNAGGPVFGQVTQNGYKRSKWGKPSRKNAARSLLRLSNLATTSTVFRFQSLAKYDNWGLNSIPLWITQTGQTQLLTGTDITVGASLRVEKFTSDYTTLWLPFYCYNLTMLPQGGTLYGGAFTCPFYQLGKSCDQAGIVKYVWRSCYGMNNGQPVATSGLMVGGQRNANPINNGSRTQSVEYTNGEDPLDVGNTALGKVPVWEHVYSKIKMIITNTVYRPTTIRTGVMSFPVGDAAPIREYCLNNTSGDATEVYDQMTTDPDKLNSITSFWDQYWNTKANHPLASVRRMSNEKRPVKFHRLEKFTIGPDSSFNKDSNGLQIRKDIVIGSQGMLRGMREESYDSSVTTQVFDQNIQNQTVASDWVAAGLDPVISGNQVTMVKTVQSGNYPGMILAKPLINAGTGAKYPCFTPNRYSSVFPARERDRWFFIQADYYMPTGASSEQADGSGQVFHADVGVPGSDATYANIAHSTLGFGITAATGFNHICPPTFDFVVESKYNLHKVI